MSQENPSGSLVEVYDAELRDRVLEPFLSRCREATFGSLAMPPLDSLPSFPKNGGITADFDKTLLMDDLANLIVKANGFDAPTTWREVDYVELQEYLLKCFTKTMAYGTVILNRGIANNVYEGFIKALDECCNGEKEGRTPHYFFPRREVTRATFEFAMVAMTAKSLFVLILTDED